MSMARHLSAASGLLFLSTAVLAQTPDLGRHLGDARRLAEHALGNSPQGLPRLHDVRGGVTTDLLGLGPSILLPAFARHRTSDCTRDSAAIRPAGYDGGPRSGWLPFAAIASLVSFTAGALLALFPSAAGSPLPQAALLLAGLSAYGGDAAIARLAGRPSGPGGPLRFTVVCLVAGLAFLLGRLAG